MRRFESHPPAAISNELTPVVSSLLGEGQVVVRNVMRTCEEEMTDRGRLDVAIDSTATPLPYVPFEKALDAEVTRKVKWTLEAVGDIAFLAGLELRQRAERLERLSGCGNHAVIIGECDSALRRIRKALMTLDRGFERAGVGEAKLDFASELQISLDVRRVYGKLRSRLREVGEPRDETFYVQLRAIGMALATVVGWKGYTTLRIRDRMQMRDLQRRLLAWFHSDRDLVAGRRLWQDVDYFVQMLADVNFRQELKEHDTRVVKETWGVVSTAKDTLPRMTVQELESLEGLDPEIDAVLNGHHRNDAAAWKGPLGRLARDLCQVRTLP